MRNCRLNHEVIKATYHYLFIGVNKFKLCYSLQLLKLLVFSFEQIKQCSICIMLKAIKNLSGKKMGVTNAQCQYMSKKKKIVLCHMDHLYFIIYIYSKFSTSFPECKTIWIT